MATPERRRSPRRKVDWPGWYQLQGETSWHVCRFIDVSATGYETRQLSVGMQEGQRLPPMKIELEPAVVQQQTATAPMQEEVRIGGVVVSKDIADALQAGNDFLNQKKYKEAVEQYEKAYPTLSANTSLKTALARATTVVCEPIMPKNAKSPRCRMRSASARSSAWLCVITRK